MDDVHDFLQRDEEARLKSLYTKASRSFFRDLVDVNDESNVLHEVDQFLARLIFATRTTEFDERSQVRNMHDRSGLNAVACQDLMLWAVLMRDQALAEFFWQKGGKYTRDSEDW